MPELIVSLLLLVSTQLLVVYFLWARTKPQKPFGLPNWITLTRNIIVSIIISLMLSDTAYEKQILIFVLAMMFLILDGVDGYLARKLDLCSDFGARFDMESDAFFILVLSVSIVLLFNMPAWVLLIGLMRYVYIALQILLPILKTPVKDRFSRKAICVFQIISLVAPFLPFVTKSIWINMLMVSLLLLIFSFGRDIKDQIRGANNEVI